jgi:hypothetical protein
MLGAQRCLASAQTLPMFWSTAGPGRPTDISFKTMCVRLRISSRAFKAVWKAKQNLEHPSPRLLD